ncbi:MAG: hypothetical protein CW342_05840 [Thermoactinomycetaceae bacterium]|nr:hypothetical protein [Bacillota bacterium]MBO2532403.1 hypothetical protein [Thermoactinomycetaceae bacterium]
MECRGINRASGVDPRTKRPQIGEEPCRTEQGRKENSHGMMMGRGSGSHQRGIPHRAGGTGARSPFSGQRRPKLTRDAGR